MIQDTSTPVVQLPANPQEVTKSQAAAWLGLAKSKNVLTHELAKMELNAQSILLPVKNSEDYKAIDAALIEYRKAHLAIIETRKPFTNAIDSGIVQPLMAFEKRVKDAPKYLTLVDKSLALRKVEADKVELQNRKNQEVTRFKSFVENEFFRIAAEYKSTLRNEISGQYEIHLTQKITPDLDILAAAVLQLQPPAPAKFETKLLTNEELMEIYAGVTKPNWTQIYNDAIEDMRSLFANFESDLSDADAAIAHNQEQAKLAELEGAQKLQEDVAINTLIATSETVVIETPKIKKTVQVVVIESEAWAKAVMAAFIVNMPQMAKYIRVKSWAKLSIGQMAEYLGKLASDEGTTLHNLQLKEVEK